MKREEKLRARFAELIAVEKQLWREGYELVAGIDEVGRGPLAGPVVTAAVVLPESFSILGVDDSKKLSQKRREALSKLIKQEALYFHIGMVDERTIDDINILEATKQAMLHTLKALFRKVEEDGGHVDMILIDALELKGISQPQKAIIKGDSTSMSIAAASVIAKVARDNIMVKYGEIYPEYGFERHKGYGTGEHIEALKKYGPLPIHRRSFIGKYL